MKSIIGQLKIGLLIPTLNAGEKWKETLRTISDQNIEVHKKIIIDSGSTDDTVTCAISHGFEVHRINKNEFGHGKTRQQLVDLAGNADICIFLTQDAILASADSLKNLVSVFTDPQVGLAYGRQLPHKGAKALETHARLYNYPAESSIHSMADSERLGFKIFFCSNSFAAYRTTALSAIGGFSADSIMGEDAIAAAKMLICGYKKAYVADATAYHSHSYTLADEFKRYFDTRVFHEQNKWLIERFGKPTGEGFKFIKSEIYYTVKNSLQSLAKSFVSIAAKWTGYKMGKYYRKMPVFFLRKFSMHNYYWVARKKS